MKRLLIVEDDAALRGMLEDYFSLKGYLVSVAESGAVFRQLTSNERYDLILLDLNLPDADGLQLLEVLRSRSSAPVFVVSGRSDEASRLTALGHGADDYVIKPFSTRELELRIHNFLCRQSGRIHPYDISYQQWRLGCWLVDERQRAIFGKDGSKLNITRGEFELLLCLLRAEGNVVSRERIIAAIEQHDVKVTPESLTVLVSRLRRKLSSTGEPSLILTVSGVGYHLAERAIPHYQAPD